MTLREIDRQYKHWAVYPPVTIGLIRVAAALGVPPPEAPGQAGPVAPSSLEELRAVAASFGVGNGQ